MLKISSTFIAFGILMTALLHAHSDPSTSNSIQNNKKSISAVAVFCGAKDGENPDYIKQAQRLGELLAQSGIKLVYGGSKAGLMGAVGDSVLKNKGYAIGYLPKHPLILEKSHTQLTERHVVDNMHERKMGMFKRSDAFVVLPGGFGTADELFEVLTWKHLGYHQKPIILVNIKGFWDPLISMIQQMMDTGFIPKEYVHKFKVVTNVDDVIAQLK